MGSVFAAFGVYFPHSYPQPSWKNLAANPRDTVWPKRLPDRLEELALTLSSRCDPC